MTIFLIKIHYCILFNRSRNDSQGRECIILNGKVESNVQDDKKKFVFSLSCTGVQEMLFAAEDEETYYEWVSKLQSVCASGTYVHVRI